MKPKNLRKNLTRVHESNYSKLLLVIPLIARIKQDVRINSNQDHCVEIGILERTKYTSLLSIRIKHQFLSDWIPDLSMTIRSYHDAQVAEVLSFQQHQRFRSRYTYPNEKMFQSDEKQQVNIFLHEWLNHCVASHLIFNGKIEPIDA
ncbi:MAG: DUF1249 domain-containing protein [Gammaproteobacteria bacterium]|nr:DUF1249 domain-containing protein [Gammaproteobacteria bacterium]MDH5803245.1 DUF1249 domain-containing protein [Gammaproteobacteria bacterium]